MRDKKGREIAYAIRNLDECQTRLTQLLEVLNNEQLGYMTDLVYEANAKNDCKKVAAKLLKGDPKTMIEVLSTYAFLLRLGDEWLKRSEYGGES
jgi:hypothetical protein